MINFRDNSCVYRDIGGWNKRSRGKPVYRRVHLITPLWRSVAIHNVINIILQHKLLYRLIDCYHRSVIELVDILGSLTNVLIIIIIIIIIIVRYMEYTTHSLT